jgi:hypothetical protein
VALFKSLQLHSRLTQRNITASTSTTVPFSRGVPFQWNPSGPALRQKENPETVYIGKMNRCTTEADVTKDPAHDYIVVGSEILSAVVMMGYIAI